MATIAPAIVPMVICLAAASLWWRRDELPGALVLTLLVLWESLVAAVVGLLIVRRHPREVVGRLLLAHAVSVALVLNLGDGPFAGWWAALTGQLLQGSWVLLYVFIALIGYVFPDGRFLSRRWKAYVAACLAGHLLFLGIAALDVESFRQDNPGVAAPLDVHLSLPVAVQVVLVVVSMGSVVALLGGAIVCAWQRLRAAAGEQRIQLLWFAWAATSIPAGLLLCWLDYWLGAHGVLLLVGVTTTGSVLPLAIGVAILRSRLFDVEVVLSRTLTYGCLTALVVGTYAAVLILVRALVGRDDLAGLLAVGVVAVAVHPVHSRVRRRVERWVYGDRSDPFAAVRRLSERLQATGDPDQVIRTLTTSVAEALRLDRVAVEVDRRDVAAVPSPVSQRVVRVPLTYHGGRLGWLAVDVPPGRSLSRADRDLLDELARHAGVVVNAVYLDLDLKASRARLVGAREEERRRLRRDLHDGLGPTLAAIVLKLNAAGAMTRDEHAAALLAEVREETRLAIEDIRRLVDDLRPPALDEVGLTAALCQRAQALSRGDALLIDVSGPTETSDLPAAAEVAAYRIATEAMANVVQHARATRCTVTVVRNGALEVTVADNGTRPWDPTRVGVGWASMRERADEIGGSCTISRRPEGGTTVRAVLPVDGARPDTTAAEQPLEQPLEMRTP